VYFSEVTHATYRYRFTTFLAGAQELFCHPVYAAQVLQLQPDIGDVYQWFFHIGFSDFLLEVYLDVRVLRCV
jgi:hypothetical protein